LRVSARAQDPDDDLVLVGACKRLPDAYLEHAYTQEKLEQGLGHYQIFFDHGGSGDVKAGDGVYSREFVIPTEIAPSVKPWAWLGGTYTLRLCGFDRAGNRSAFLNVPIKVEPPPLRKGSPPVVEKAWTEPANVSGPPGTPYLLKAKVRDADADVLQVRAELWELDSHLRLVDDGTWGDEVADDGVFTRARVIGDSYEAAAPKERQTIHALVQALDVGGHFSNTATVRVDAHYGEADPVLSGPAGPGPRIADIWTSGKETAPVSVWRVTARADRPDVWMMIFDHEQRSYDVMADDGFEWDAKRGDGVYSWGWYEWPPGVRRYTVYAIPKSGPPVTGAKAEVTVRVIER